jgi:ATP-dependent DNA helicase RecG
MGYGIHGMFEGQAKRFFPLPDYDLSDPSAVKMTLYGKIVDPAYSRLLIQKSGLSLPDIQALDRIQKHLSVDADAVERLRKARLIEGRKPNLHIAATIAEITGNKASYIRTRAQDDTFYAKLILDYLAKFGSASRMEINELLKSKLSDSLSERQKESKINNLLSNMRIDGKIRNTSSRKASRWEVAD